MRSIRVLVSGAGLEHLGAGGAFGIFELAMLGDDERAPEGDHHENAEQAAEQADEHDTANLQVEAQDHDGRHRHAEAEGDGLAGRAGGLDDVVLEDGGILTAELGPEPEEGERDHRDGDGCADGQANLEDEVEGGGAEDHAQQSAEDDGAHGEFAHVRAGGDVGLEAGGGFGWGFGDRGLHA